MRVIRATALTILDGIRYWLAEEPARLVGYGLAVAIYLALRFLEAHDFLVFPDATFEEVLTWVGTTMASLVIIVESIRRFVYSPQTYIEDLSDEAEAAHELAHLEEQFRALQVELERAAIERAEPKTGTNIIKTVNIGSTKAKGSTEKPD